MSTAYLIEGTTGAHTFKRTWYVCVFADRAKAEDLLEKLHEWCRTHKCHKYHTPEREIWVFHSTYSKELKPPEDPQFRCSTWTGVFYSLTEVAADFG